MNEMDISTFDKLLLEAGMKDTIYLFDIRFRCYCFNMWIHSLVFQSEQESQKKENTKEYIQRKSETILKCY